MTSAEDVARAVQSFSTRRRDWTDILMAERCRAQIAAKRQRDNAMAARNRAGRDGATLELLAQLDRALALATIELMGAVDAVNHGFATIEAERDGLVLPGVSK